MYYIIYDRDYPMTAFMSYDDIIGMAEDVIGNQTTLKEVGFAPFPGLRHEPQTKQEYLQAAQQVLEREWGLYMVFPYEEASEFVWYAAENGIEEQGIALVAKHDPELAKIEYGVEL